jgi:hypothetical protein
MTITELITMLETLRKAEGEVDVRVIGLDRYGEMDGTYCDPVLHPSEYDFDGYVLDCE